MKVKLGKKESEYYAGIYTGKGGISSCINWRQSASIWYVLKVFKPKNLWIALVGKQRYNSFKIK